MAVLLCARSVADIPKTEIIGSDAKSFLDKSSFEIESWFVAGVTNQGPKPQDFIQRLREASAKGNIWAQGYLGMLLLEGDGVPPNPDEGIRLLRSSAGKGCVPAMNHLGFAYLEGRGVPANPAEGLIWIQPAARLGWANAQFNLGYSYERGLGVETNFVQAAAWYRMAAMQGHPSAMGSLGLLYNKGLGVPRDNRRAERWLLDAIKAGNVRAKLNLGVIYLDEGLGTNGPEAGVLLIREAANAGDFRAQWQLAFMHFHGKGVPKDLTNYMAWARKSAEQGLAEPQFYLGCALQTGEILPQDSVQARLWF